MQHLHARQAATCRPSLRQRLAIDGMKLQRALLGVIVLKEPFGRDRVLAAYRHAVAQRFRFCSYGDAMHSSREVRILAIRRIANRALNSTPASIELNKAYFMRPLRNMSKSTVILGTQFPGDIQPPRDGDITIEWTSNKAVTIYMIVRPNPFPVSTGINR